ncbi:MAG: insulinase family protein [Pseudomonadota bacterium]|nr:insulinase family protein [Pseudomonadota bacterium]
MAKLNFVHLTSAIAIATAVPTAAHATQPAPAAAAASVPPLQYTQRTLANGLRVYAMPDASSPNVSVQVWYDVGSKDDPAGRSGFAHLFEHLMFKATRNMVPEQFDRLTEDVGGFNNASTADDYTNYYEVVPANHLQRLLWAEAERMGSLVVEQSYFASERDVVKEELRSRVLAAPYGKLFYLYIPQVSYSVHPYARPGIGSIEDLDAAKIDDVRAFHATYYRPDNAVLVVSGRFDQAQLDRWIDQYFGPIARPSAPIPRVTVAEPPRNAARSYTVYEPNTPLPAVLLSYPLPPASSEESAVLEVANAILSSGRSSRLYQSLIYQKGVASEADTYSDVKQGQGALAAYAILASGKSAAEGETALRAEIARLRDAPVTAAELAEAKNELLTGALRERETVEGKADALAGAVILAGDPTAADRRLARIAATTPADIQRVARTYLAESKSAAIRYLPEPAGASPKEDLIATPATVRTARLSAPADIRVVEPASDAERVAPPAPGAEVATRLPTPVIQKLANGLTVITVPRNDLPLATALLVSNQGSASDPDGKAGLARLAAQLTTKGTATRSASEIASQIEALGGTLNSGADFDGSNLSVTVKSDQISPALAILADAARNPTFTAEEIERQRAINVDEVTVTLQDPGDLSRLVANRALFGSGAYGQPTSGTPASLKAIGRDDVLAAYRRAFTPANGTLVLTGAVDPASALALANRYFGDWTAVVPTQQQRPTASGGTPGRVIVVDMPGAGQAAVAVVKQGIARSDARFYPLLVANTVLGGGYSSRLNQEIRIKRGLAYGAGSSVEARLHPGPTAATTQTKNESAPEVLGLILAELQRLGAEPIPMAELGTRKAVLNGGFGRSLETTSGLATLIANYVVRGVSLDEIARYQQSVSAISPNEAGAAARSVLAPAGATVVIVGDASKFVDQLRKQRGDVTVIPADKLDLQNLGAAAGN